MAGYVPRNLHARLIEDVVELAAADVDTDASGNITITFPNIRQIFSEATVYVSIEGGYVAQVISISGNTATVRIYQGDYDQSADAPLTAVASGTDLGILHARALGSK